MNLRWASGWERCVCVPVLFLECSIGALLALSSFQDITGPRNDHFGKDSKLGFLLDLLCDKKIQVWLGGKIIKAR
jgi:hypothetical protein